MAEDFNKFESLTSSVRHFERVMRSLMKIQDMQGERIKLGIRAGMAFLGLFGLSIFIILYSMATQIQRVSEAVGQMNHSFEVVAERMERVDQLMASLEHNVALLSDIGEAMPGMDSQMGDLTQTIAQMRTEMGAISQDVTAVRAQSEQMSNIAMNMNDSIYRMNHEVERMSRPAQSMNKMAPFMP